MFFFFNVFTYIMIIFSYIFFNMFTLFNAVCTETIDNSFENIFDNFAKLIKNNDSFIIFNYLLFRHNNVINKNII